MLKIILTIFSYFIIFFLGFFTAAVLGATRKRLDEIEIFNLRKKLSEAALDLHISEKKEDEDA